MTASFLFLLINGRAITSLDSLPYYHLPIAMLRYHTFRLQMFPNLANPLYYSVVHDKDGYLISKKPVAPALLQLPGYLVYRLIKGQWPIEMTHFMLLSKLTMSTVASAAAAMLTIIMLAAGVRRRWLAVGAGLGLIMLTPFWFTAMDFWPHPVLALLNVCSLLLLLRRRNKNWAWALIGLCQGLAFATRAGAIMVWLAFVVALFLADEKSFKERRTNLAAMFTGAFFPLLLLACYNQIYFGSPFSSGFGHQAANRIQWPWEGLAGLILSPIGGILIFSPIIALITFAFRGELWRRLEVKLAMIAILLHLLFWACYSDWMGGWCYGPRYLAEVMPFAVFLTALSVDALLTRTHHKAIIASLIGMLAVVSLAIQLIGMFGYDADFYRLYDKGFMGQKRFWIWHVPPVPLWTLQHGHWYPPKHIP